MLRVRRSSIRFLLPSCLKELLKRREYIETSNSIPTVLKITQYLPKKILREGDSNFSANSHYLINGQTIKPFKKISKSYHNKKKRDQPTKASATKKYTRKSLTTRVTPLLIASFFLLEPYLVRMTFSYRFLNQFLLQITHLQRSLMA